MERPYQIYAARPLTEKTLRAHLSKPLLRADHQGADEPSFAQSLTRLQHLRRHLFRAEDWEELSWLINEGTHFEERRQRKHPLFKFGPRRKLQEKVQHFHGRAAVKAAALASAMEPPMRRLVVRLESSSPAPKAIASIPWRRFDEHPATKIGAPLPVQSADLLLAMAPLLRALLEMVAPLDREQTKMLEQYKHFAWHAREIRAEQAKPFYRFIPFRPHRKINRLLRIALEHAQTLLCHLRDVHLITASGLHPDDLDRHP